MEEIKPLVKYYISRFLNENTRGISEIKFNNTELIPDLNLGDTFFYKSNFYTVIGIIKDIENNKKIIFEINSKKYTIMK